MIDVGGKFGQTDAGTKGEKIAMGVCITLIFALIAAWPAAAADSPLQVHIKQLKGKQFLLRAPLELFGAARFAGTRSIREAQIYWEADLVSIGNGIDSVDWQGKYFIPARSYLVKDVSFNNGKNLAQIKLSATGMAVSDDLWLDFPDASGLNEGSFDRLFFTVFFAPAEDVGKYERDNDAKLISVYLDPFPELLTLPDADRKKILFATRAIGLSSSPRLEKVGNDLYIPRQMVDISVYNDIQVSKNQRIASSIERELIFIKAAAIDLAALPSLIHGVRYYWTVMHRNFLGPSSVTSDRLELLASSDSIKGLAAGNLSVLEMLQTSILRMDGTKVTLSSYEPIGQR
jgi:hypothetical protein